MSTIILAFVAGALFGMGYMYMQYSKMIREHLRELEEIRLNHARIEGQMQILNRINGIEEEDHA
jgi:uncharacterized membrane protein